MKNRSSMYLGMTALVMLSLPAHAQAALVYDTASPEAQAASDAYLADLMPQPLTQNGIRYITGGIGEEDRDAMRQVKPEYNVHITSASKSGGYKGQSQIVILNRSGQEVLRSEAGPLFYTQLPQGSYTVRVSNSGQEVTRKISVDSRTQADINVHFMN